jgi:hypothetical protein
MMCASALGPLSSGHWFAFATLGDKSRDGVVDDSEQAATTIATPINVDQRQAEGSSGIGRFSFKWLMRLYLAQARTPPRRDDSAVGVTGNAPL